MGEKRARNSGEILGALGIRQVLGALLMGDLRGLGELVSEGKSGSLFCESNNGLPVRPRLSCTISSSDANCCQQTTQREAPLRTERSASCVH